ncbi:MAG: hypothetical protein A2022_02930 [Deltaproteobacteria bacterium GWF2_42_12]|nr:MAG: hypothetical protein A2022_02930 [Deltaproteobacteria bacterium GWF2_42_12]
MNAQFQPKWNIQTGCNHYVTRKAELYAFINTNAMSGVSLQGAETVGEGLVPSVDTTPEAFLVLSVDIIQQGVSVKIEASEVEKV